MGDAYRVLITGSREWDDWRTIVRALTEATDGKPRPVTLVHGCARGADSLAAQAARKLGWEVEDHPADWDRHGKAAGLRRNAEMVALGADVCLCFAMPCTGSRCTRPRPHDSHGASDCADRAKSAGIPVRRFRGVTQ